MATAVKVQPLTQRAAWKALESHFEKVRNIPLRSLFADEPERASRFTIEAAGLFLDYSKNRITEETRKLLLQLAQESGLRERMDAMFHGDKINVTEKRAVLHVALRAPKGEAIFVDGEDVVPGVHAVLDKMTAFLRPYPQRGLERAYRQAHPQYRQHRHRGLRSRPGDGL